MQQTWLSCRGGAQPEKLCKRHRQETPTPHTCGLLYPTTDLSGLSGSPEPVLNHVTSGFVWNNPLQTQVLLFWCLNTIRQKQYHNIWGGVTG